MNLEQTLQRLEAAKGDPLRVALAAVDIVLAAEDPRLAKALEVAAVPHWFDESMLRVLLGTETRAGEKWFERLTALSVVERFRTRNAWNVHDVTRQALRRRLISSDRSRFRDLSHRAASLVSGNEAAHEIERLYHLLSADPDAGADALRRTWKRWDRLGQVEALQALAKNLDELRDQGLLRGRVLAYSLVCLISVWLERIPLATSLHMAQEAVDIVRGTADQLGRVDAYAALGDVLRASGRTTEALAAYGQARTSLLNTDLERVSAEEATDEDSELHTKTGRTFQERGEPAMAHLHFGLSMAIRRKAWEADPDSELKKVELGVSYADMGDVLLPTDRASEAEEQYVEALRLFETMAGKVIGAQRLDANIGRIQLRLGHAAWVRGAPADGMEHFHAAVDAFRRCVEADPEHFGYRNDVAHAYHQIGGVCFRRGDLSATEKKFEAAREIWADLSERDPTNPSWKNALACLHSDFGDLREKQAQLDDALREHHMSVKLHKDLVSGDSNRAQEKRNYADALTSLGTFYLRVASELEDDQQKAFALASAWEMLGEASQIRSELAERDPGNTDWRSGFGVGQRRLADAAQALAKHIDTSTSPRTEISSDRLRRLALLGYASSLSTFSELTAQVPHDTRFKRNLCLAALGLGQLHKTLNEVEPALKAFRCALSVGQELVALDPSNVLWAEDLKRAIAEIKQLTRAQIIERRQ